MAANKIDIKTYQPKSGDCFFFDNNVWIYIFGPVASYNKNLQQIYSRFLSATQTAGATIFINSMILSEFSNRILRLNFDQWKRKCGIINPDYKRDFIGTQNYKEAVTEIKQHVKSIAKITLKSSDDFNAINLDKVMTHLEFIDFNDSYMLEMAALRKWKIVTDDSDFVKYQAHSVTVITTR